MFLELSPPVSLLKPTQWLIVIFHDAAFLSDNSHGGLAGDESILDLVLCVHPRYVVLIDRHRTPEILDNQPAILPQPLMSRQLHQLLSSTGLLARCPGLVDFCPQLTMSNTTKAQQRSQSSPSMLRRATTHPPQPSDRPPFSPRGEMSSATPLQLSLSGSPEGADLRQFGVMGLFGGLRAILGPLSCQEVMPALP